MSTENTDIRKLYRSPSDRYIGGVCGGLGDYFKVDSNLFRILFVILTFTGGIGIILYVTAYIVVPENPEPAGELRGKSKQDSTYLIAMILIVLGALILLKEFGLFHYFHFWSIPWSSIWAVFLIVIGIIIIYAAQNNKTITESSGHETSPNNVKRIYRSRRNRYLAGVCGGIGEYFSIDPSIIRLLWIFATLASVGLGILVYVILIFVFPDGPVKL